jgi:DnaJ domain
MAELVTITPSGALTLLCSLLPTSWKKQDQMATFTPGALNPYELLGIASDARDDAINKAFRQKSLKVHPDRNPDNPEAGKFLSLIHGNHFFLTFARLKI